MCIFIAEFAFLCDERITHWETCVKIQKRCRAVKNRAEKLSGAKQQAANFQWYEVKVEIVGVIKDRARFRETTMFRPQTFNSA